jgi:hypothetical protein
MVYGSKSGPLDLGLGVYGESSIPDHTKFDQHLQLLIPWCGWFRQMWRHGIEPLVSGSDTQLWHMWKMRTRSGRTGGTGKLMLRNSEYGLYL